MDVYMDVFSNMVALSKYVYIYSNIQQLATQLEGYLVINWSE